MEIVGTKLNFPTHLVYGDHYLNISQPLFGTLRILIGIKINKSEANLDKNCVKIFSIFLCLSQSLTYVFRSVVDVTGYHANIVSNLFSQATSQCNCFLFSCLQTTDLVNKIQYYNYKIQY